MLLIISSKITAIANKISDLSLHAKTQIKDLLLAIKFQQKTLF